MSQGRICSDNCTRCHIETEVAYQTFYLAQSQYTDTGPTRPRVDPIAPGAWQGSHWSASFQVTGITRPGKIPAQAGIKPGSAALEADALTTRPTRRYAMWGIELCGPIGQRSPNRVSVKGSANIAYFGKLKLQEKMCGLSALP